ncbi:MAG: DUF6691 family protein [Verrucomicrobiota bacterium]
MKWFVLFLSGLLFGAGLVLAGMTDPAKVIGFLDFTGSWDPALAFVMGGAVTTFGLGQFVIRRKGIRLFGKPLPDTSADPVSGRMVIGSAIFGMGWGLGGFCPGPALANLASMRKEALLFVALMLLGMVIAQRLFKLDEPGKMALVDENPPSK